MRGDSHSSHHVVPLSVYIAVFVTLLALTALTIWVAVLDLGAYSWLHTPLALLIAGIKAAAVVVWFMHVRYSVRLTWVFVAAGVLWLAILLAITFADYVARDWEMAPQGWRAERACALEARELA